ncbi:sigma-70 family RNA polymerase sigma factor [Microlunatus sp. Y2014]|uniref:sigma-70 family RNA polymerase sigma factor n=1 Tax=Microlunatus sp. Y2014 TaxID=3418488 RepID=UPI003DA7173A
MTVEVRMGDGPTVGDDPGGSDLPLDELLTRSAAGDDQAFAQLYDRTSSRVYGLALRVLKTPDHAAEVTQEVYLEAWRTAGRHRTDRGSVMAWLLTITHRRAVDRVRAVERQRGRDTRYDRATGVSDDRPTAVGSDPVWDGVSQRFDVERVRLALNALTDHQREALTLSYFDGYSQSRVAAELGLPLGTVKSRIRDGLRHLGRVLGREDERHS